MKKQLLKERFQQLAGIKPLYEQEDDTKKVEGFLNTQQENFSQLLQVAGDYYIGWSNGKSPSKVDSQHGFRIEEDPSWDAVKGKLTGRDLYLYFLYHSTVYNPNLTHNLPGIKDGNINLFIDKIIEEISLLDFDPMNLIGFSGVDFVKDLGSGDVKQNRDIIMRLLTTDINELYNVYNSKEVPVSGKEMYDLLKGGTLDSASWHASTSQSEE